MVCIEFGSGYRDFVGAQPQVGFFVGQLAGAAVPIAMSFVNMGLLALAMRGLPAGMTYALWTGAGTVGVVLGGALFFGDKVSLPQLFFIALIIIGSVGTKFFSSQA